MKTEQLFKVLFVFTIITQFCHSEVSEATWNAVIEKRIIIVLNDSQEIKARVISYKDSIVKIVKDDGYITPIYVRDVNSIRMDAEQTSAKEYEVIDKSFRKEKTFGVFLGIIPQPYTMTLYPFITGIIGFNADIKNVNLFASASYLIPILSNGKKWAFSIGAGKLFNIGESRWKFNIFSNISLFKEKHYDYEYFWERNYAVGVGIGFQYTTKNGILISFKAPVVGFSFNSEGIEGNGAAKYYYPYSMASLPIIVFGKVF